MEARAPCVFRELFVQINFKAATSAVLSAERARSCEVRRRFRPMPNTRTEKVDPLEIDTVGLLAKPRRRCHAPLALSCALNAVFAISLVMVLGTDWFPEVDRSREQCGGHGMLYEGADECECFDCWSGPFCAEKLEGDACVVTANSGTPYIFEAVSYTHLTLPTILLV